MDTVSEDRRLQSEWWRVSDRLKAEIGNTAFENWVKPIRACDFKNAQVRLSVPSRFMRDWVVANYLDRLKELWAGENESVRSVGLFIQTTQKRTAQSFLHNKTNRLYAFVSLDYQYFN